LPLDPADSMVPIHRFHQQFSSGHDLTPPPPPTALPHFPLANMKQYNFSHFQLPALTSFSKAFHFWQT
ncbi:hypothetical protein CDAR_599901, partial [Caerostris darwini]